jgi:RNA polymerase sigma factor (sigma-70 family)
VEADDIAQETFLRLYRNPPPRDENLQGWLRQVATNLAYNQMRSDKRRRQREEKDFLLSGELSPGPDPEQLAISGLAQEAIRRALNTLSPRDRMALLLRAEGCRYREIACALGVQQSSVGTILVRAQKKLLLKFQEMGGYEIEVP